MKRVIVTMVLMMTLGTSSSANIWNWGAGAADLSATVPSLWSTPAQNPKQAPKKPNMPQHYMDIIKLLKQQLEQANKTHKSITENRGSGAGKPEYSSFFIKDPQSIYNKERIPKILSSLNEMQRNEDLFGSADDVRKSIEKRISYETVTNRNISSEAFQNTEARLNYILLLLGQIDQTKDLKAISELNTRVLGASAMVQNEATKLQMLTHLRNTERELIRQQKDRHNTKILNSKNTEMPSISIDHRVVQ